MKPNLFILGAGKCGTTSLYRILSLHPEIHASAVKEPTFFCWPFQVVRSPIAYFKLFESPKRYRFEASHAYFSNPETPAVLRELFPEARFIISLRQPKNRAFSLYQHMRRPVAKLGGKSYEKLSPFHEALIAEPERFQSKDFQANCPHYFWNFMYVRSSLYDEQLARYFALFDRRQFHIISLAELASDQSGTIDGIMKFLGLDFTAMRDVNLSAENAGAAQEICAAESDEFMDAAFDGLTRRVDRLAGRALDWSL